MSVIVAFPDQRPYMALVDFLEPLEMCGIVVLAREVVYNAADIHPSRT